MISKSDFIQYIQHPCLLWLSKNEPEKLPGISDNLLQLFEDGRELEKYAEARFANLQRGMLPTQPGQVSAQCTFHWEDFECRTDLLEVQEDGSLHLIEIKSSTGPKPLHIYDLAFQKHVLVQNGYVVSRTSVMHINNQYTRTGEVNPHELLALTDVTSEVVALTGIPDLMTIGKECGQLVRDAKPFSTALP